MTKSFSLRTPLGRAKGLGSSKHGVDHWIAQRVSAIALAFLGLWLVWALVQIGGLEATEIKTWLQGPMALLGMVLTVCVTLYHGYLGLQIVIEDYVHGSFWGTALQIFVKFLTVVAGTVAILALLKIGLGIGLS